MKLADYKKKIDSYFEVISPSEIISRFKHLGYEFEPIPHDYFCHELTERPAQESERSFSLVEFFEFEQNSMIVKIGEFNSFSSSSLSSILQIKGDSSEFEDDSKFALAA